MSELTTPNRDPSTSALVGGPPEGSSVDPRVWWVTQLKYRSLLAVVFALPGVVILPLLLLYHPSTAHVPAGGAGGGAGGIGGGAGGTPGAGTSAPIAQVQSAVQSFIDAVLDVFADPLGSAIIAAWVVVVFTTDYLLAARVGARPWSAFGHRRRVRTAVWATWAGVPLVLLVWGLLIVPSQTFACIGANALVGIVLPIGLAYEKIRWLMTSPRKRPRQRSNVAPAA